MRLCRTISSVKKLYVMLNLITSALGWKTIFRKQMLNTIFWDGSINVISTSGEHGSFIYENLTFCPKMPFGS